MSFGDFAYRVCRGVERGARRLDYIEGTAPAAEFDLFEDDLREIEDIMQGAVMVGGPSPEGVSHYSNTLLSARLRSRGFHSNSASGSHG